MTRQQLKGWGMTAPTTADVVSVQIADDARSALAAAGPRGLLARGLGRSYGDAGQNAGGTVLDMTSFDAILDVDSDARTMRVQAGLSLDALLRAALVRGWWVPVLPGTRQVTIGGAIAADVHGKNHHVDGSFGQHVRSLSLLLASDDVVEVTPDDALFWATVGGMGLTGVVLEATLELKPVETSWFVVDTDRTPQLRTLMDVLAEGEPHHPYSVAWFDTATRGDSLGRGVVTQGRAARLDELPLARRDTALELAAPDFGSLPVTPPIGFVNGLTARAFNELWFRKAPQHRRDELQDVTQFFHPLDIIGDWNRVYGPRGFCQYQCVVPFGAEDALVAVVDAIAASRHVSSLNVLKRFGPGNASPLSFPMPGWTLAVDLPVRRGLDDLLTALDRIVLDSGGRLYLAKDSRMSATDFAAMYPRLDDFRAIRAEVDPFGLLRSDLARRLEL